MANFLRGNTHPTALQHAIEQATDGNQTSEDWGMIMKICDHISTHGESAKEAMKIIRKRLQCNPATNGWHTIGLTLSLLEALTKNCGKIFHLQIAHKEFLKELKALIGPKNHPPIAVQERVLGMIQTWALAFQNDPDLKAVHHFYQECKHQGLQFPQAEPENSIKTSVPSTRTMERPLQATRSTTRPITNEISSTISAEQIAKLRSELDVVQTNLEVFGEMLVTLQPGEEDPQDFELLRELYHTSKQMQTRIVDLLSQVSIDDITVDLLRYNDEFNNAFKTFENYMQERDRRISLSPMTGINQIKKVLINPITSMNNSDNEPSLIRFDDEPVTVTTNFQNMNLSTIPKSSIIQSTASTNNNNNQDPERDVRELEQWLKSQGDESDTDDGTHQASGTTTAFNNFLQKRASTIPTESSAQNYPNFSNNTHI